MIDKLRKKLLNQRGFTLMELLIVIAIIAILTVAFLPNALRAPAKARDTVKIKKIQDIQTAVEAQTAERGNPPDSQENNGNCLDDAIATSMNLSETPKDTTNKTSCTGAADLYYYKNSADAFYIIGIKVEVEQSANASAIIGILDPIADLASAKALIQQAKPAAILANEEPWFLAVGPI